MNKATLAAIIAITGLESLALCKGINGAVFGIAIASLAGLGGYEIKNRKPPKKGGA